MKRIPPTIEHRNKRARCAGWLATWCVRLSGGSQLHPRSGTTLTEVLVSILVMSIGIVSLTSIFPLSLARSIRSAQLTNATISRYNCEAMLDTDPTILAAVPVSTKVIIDPIGYNMMNADRPALKDVFGNDGTNVSGTLARLNGGRTNLADADFLVTLPDSWTQIHEGRWLSFTPSTNPPNSPKAVTVSGLGAALPAMPTNLVKITMFHEGEGKLLSATKIGRTITGDTIGWDDAVSTDQLATGLSNFGMVRIEKQNRNYTWLVTARRDSLVNVSVDVVVFFRRSFTVEDETVYSATFVNGSRDVAVTWPSGARIFLKKGSYVFDPDNAFWYQIGDLKSQTSTSATIELDRPAAASSPGGGGRAIFMKGIVEVYHIEDKKV